MQKKDILQRLNDLGYVRAENSILSVPGKTFYKESYKAKMLNHTIIEHVRFVECDFDEASITGSIFRHCSFINCSLDQVDFEFCEFYSCIFESNIPFGSSFNDSSFVETEFLDVNFRSCTFTGAFFQACLLNRVQIAVSTMENSRFRQCNFKNMDLRLLNMDYVELDHPSMENVVLPLDQIPFMFGSLQYLKYTKDSVKISKGKSETMTPSAFFRNVVPLLCTHFRKSKQFFPLANLYYSQDKKTEGYQAVTDGLVSFISIRDFRMLKHFCKLIAYSGAFHPSALHNLYHNYICRLYPQNEIGLDIPNYARHIMEIKALLFSSAQKASFRLTLETNIGLHENQKLGKILESLFFLSKYQGAFSDNDIEISLRQNSPLQVTVQINGNEDQLVELLAAYLFLIGINNEDFQTLPVLAQYRKILPSHMCRNQELEIMTRTYQQGLQKLKIQVVLLEYYVENFQHYCNRNEPVYFFNSSAVPAGNHMIDTNGGGHGESI